MTTHMSRDGQHERDDVTLVPSCQAITGDSRKFGDVIVVRTLACGLCFVAPSFDLVREDPRREYLARRIFRFRQELVEERKPLGVLSPTQSPAL